MISETGITDQKKEYKLVGARIAQMQLSPNQASEQGQNVKEEQSLTMEDLDLYDGPSYNNRLKEQLRLQRAL